MIPQRSCWSETWEKALPTRASTPHFGALWKGLSSWRCKRTATGKAETDSPWMPVHSSLRSSMRARKGPSSSASRRRASSGLPWKVWGSKPAKLPWSATMLRQTSRARRKPGSRVYRSGPENGGLAAMWRRRISYSIVLPLCLWLWKERDEDQRHTGRDGRALRTGLDHEQVRQGVRDAGVDEGICNIPSGHTTAAVTVNEDYDRDVPRDLASACRAFLDALDVCFKHAEGNSDSHLLTS